MLAGLQGQVQNIKGQVQNYLGAVANHEGSVYNQVNAQPSERGRANVPLLSRCNQCAYERERDHPSKPVSCCNRVSVAILRAQGGAVSNVRGTVQNIQGNVSNYGGVVGNAYGQVSVPRLSDGLVTAFCCSAPWLRHDVVIMLQQSLLLAITGICEALTA